MNSENAATVIAGIEGARATLGDLVTAAQQGTTIILTSNGRAAATQQRACEHQRQAQSHHRFPSDDGSAGRRGVHSDAGA